MPDSSELLLKFIQEEDYAESEVTLGLLFANIVKPRVESTLRRRLGVTMSAHDASASNLDALELQSDIHSQLLQVFRNIRSASGQNGNRIEYPDAYIRAVTNNAFRQYLRDKYPLRFRLKNKIRYILKNVPVYSLWLAADGREQCGRSAERASTAHPE